MTGKVISLLAGCFSFLAIAQAQSNTFPSSGNVGIGITPVTKLHVLGDTRIERQSGGNNHFLFSFTSGGNYLTSDDPGANHKDMYLRVLSSATGTNNRSMYFQTGLKDGTLYTRMTIRHDGNIGIGTTNPQAKLAVNGNILATEVKVKSDIFVPDYVFDPNYELPSLSEIEAYVKAHRHLPEIPSATDIKRDGLDLAEMNLLLLKKVEELTLHLIEERKAREDLVEKVAALEELVTK